MLEILLTKKMTTTRDRVSVRVGRVNDVLQIPVQSYTEEKRYLTARLCINYNLQFLQKMRCNHTG